MRDDLGRPVRVRQQPWGTPPPRVQSVLSGSLDAAERQTGQTFCTGFRLATAPGQVASWMRRSKLFSAMVESSRMEAMSLTVCASRCGSLVRATGPGDTMARSWELRA